MLKMITTINSEIINYNEIIKNIFILLNEFKLIFILIIILLIFICIILNNINKNIKNNKKGVNKN